MALRKLDERAKAPTHIITFSFSIIMALALGAGICPSTGMTGQGLSTAMPLEAILGVKETVRIGFLDWLLTCNVVGDDGQRYEVGASVLSMNVEQIDFVDHVPRRGLRTL